MPPAMVRLCMSGMTHSPRAAHCCMKMSKMPPHVLPCERASSPENPEHDHPHSSGTEACNGPGYWNIIIIMITLLTNLNIVSVIWLTSSSCVSIKSGRQSHFAAHQTDHDIHLVKREKKLFPKLLKPLCSVQY